MPNDLSTKVQQPDINDVFEEILFSEEKVIEKGYQQGYSIGRTEDNPEGYHLGYHRGAEIGSEIGYYQAFVDHHLDITKSASEKVVKLLEKLKKVCDEFPHTNSEQFDIFELLETVRSCYKRVCILLKVSTSFHKEGLSF
ncbi:protein LTO1 homolog [Anthonomus grandis grandis]|uniref:protein LTO1 homolog n=1 Tax=Anthonomus grandis grandis TaxID=2921223 RepID=UPI002166AC36|nr:protein LTO1 homolog [Anthonomus grandis grandis]